MYIVIVLLDVWDIWIEFNSDEYWLIVLRFVELDMDVWPYTTLKRGEVFIQNEVCLKRQAKISIIKKIKQAALDDFVTVKIL